MQIIDYVIIGVAVLFLIIGLWRGLVKMTFGVLAGLASLVIAIMLCTTVAGAIVSGTDWADGLSNQLVTKIDVGTSTELVYNRQPNQDILGYYVENINGEQIFKEFDELFEGNVFLQIFSGFMEKGITASYTPEVAAQKPQFAAVLIASWLSVLILQVICFFALWILIAIVFKIISILLKKLVSMTFVGHFLDRTLGGVMGVAIAWVIVMVVFTVFALLEATSFMAPVVDHIKSSIIGKFLYDNNFIYKLVSANIDFSSVFSGASAALMTMTLV